MLNRTFAVYLLGRVFVTLASTMLSVAVGWHLYRATGNPFDLALVGLMQVMPIIGLFIVAGWVVDNFSRRAILVACCLLLSLVYVGLAMAIDSDDVDRLAVFGLLFVNGIARVFFGPAMQSMLPNIVSRADLSRAIATSTTVWTIAATAGPFLAGVLIAWLDTGIYPLLFVVALVAAGCFSVLPDIAVIRSTGRGVSQLLDGVRYVLSNPFVFPAISLDLVIVLLSSVVALLPVYAIDILGVGPEALGTLRAMPAFGAAAAGVLMARLPIARHAGRLLFLALLLFSGSVIVFAFSTVFWLSLAALFVYGATDMVSVNVRTTIIQLATPDRLRGRVNAVNSLFIASSNDLGDFRAGGVAAVLGPVATVVTGGLMACGVAVGGYYGFARLRSLDRMSDAELNADGRSEATGT